jgi:hypothetical protein
VCTNQLSTSSSTTTATKPVIASSRGPSGEAALMSACTANQVATVAPNAAAAPATTGRRRARLAPRKLAVTAAKISTASKPSRKTIMLELNTTVAWLCACEASVGSIGPVLAVAIR